MNSVSTRIKRMMDEKGIKNSELARNVDIARSTVTKWFSEDTEPKASTVQKIAEFYNVPVSWFYEIEHEETFDKSIQGKLEELTHPLYAVSAGQGVINDGHPTETITEEEDMTLENGYCRVIGDSMYPILHDGDCIKIRPQTATEPTDLTVLRIDGEAITVKYVEVTDTGIWVRAENKDVFEDRFYSIQEVLSLPISIIGKAVSIVERKL